MDLGILQMSREFFGHLPTGEEVYIYELANKNGMSIRVMEYGATLVSVKVPNKFGDRREDIVLGKEF